ncbi:uncharacterized protein LOC129614716 [Condylostylus longicornis]|uniref:uncharacterized protein LOC129614716 n=1 Tax=Condylostylus longicornis TaxID=2530218 RepID=UPI00244E095D|nr:uncharacterized protein LOC129614716 [Condylostylus longicornis]
MNIHQKTIISQIKIIVDQWELHNNLKTFLHPSSEFEKKFAFSGVKDGCHIQIQQPPGNAYYYNRNNVLSKVLEKSSTGYDARIKLQKLSEKYSLSDFYAIEDITEPKSPEPNITIENFDSNGEIASPTAPCLAVTIDSEYIKDCKKRPKIRKFLFCYERLKEIETLAFTEMEEEHKKLKTLELTNLENHLKDLESQYQQIYMSLIEIYFDTVSPENYYIEEVNALMTNELKPFLEEMPEKYDKEQMLKLQNCMDNQIRPYLKKKSYLNSELWFQMKVFKYRTQPKIVLVDPTFPKDRTNILKEKANTLFEQWSKQYKSNKIMAQYDATISTILSKLETDEEKQVKLFVTSSSKKNAANKALNVEEKIGKIQDLIMEFLHQLDDMPPNLLKSTERSVRYRLGKQKKKAKNALVLQTRFQNLLNHYKNHFKKQNISKDYITLIPRERSKPKK